MNRLLYITLVFFIFYTCITGCSDKEGLVIKINNRTGFDVDSARIGDKYIRLLKTGKSITINDCKSVFMQAGRPFGFSDGIIQGKQKEINPIPLCGTFVEEVTKGKFEFDLVILEYNSRYSLMMVWPKNTYHQE